MRITSDFAAPNFANSDSQTHSKLADAAQQFEAMLLQELLKPMRKEDGGWDGDEKTDGASDAMISFGTEAMAKAISQGGGLGIARQVIRQVSTEYKKNQKGT